MSFTKEHNHNKRNKTGKPIPKRELALLVKEHNVRTLLYNINNVVLFRCNCYKVLVTIFAIELVLNHPILISVL